MPNIAIVYDWLDSQGGAERVLKVLHESFPEADWYASTVDLELPWLQGWNVHTTFIQKLPGFIRRNRVISLLLYSYAFESLDLSSYDVVVSVTSAFAKSVITKSDTKHICYLLTPPRWLWDDEQERAYRAGIPVWARGWVRYIRAYLQRWDFQAAQRVDEYLCISEEVQKRCMKYYDRESELLYPPFDFDYWGTFAKKAASYKLQAARHNAYFLVVGRQEAYKRVDLAIEGYAEYVRKTKGTEDLVVIGTGRQHLQLVAQVKAMGLGSRVKFVVDITDQELAVYYANASALVMAQVEDWGYVACEAIACRCPVVAYVNGGQREIIVEGVTGVLFAEQTSNAIASALEKVRFIEYNPDSYENSHIRRWSRNTFVATLTQKITEAV